MNFLRKVNARFTSKGVVAAFLLLFILASVLYADKNFLSVVSITNLLKKTSTDGGLLAEIGRAHV